MADFKEEERLKALRERLYARGKASASGHKPFKLTDEPKDAPTSWQQPPGAKRPQEGTQQTQQTQRQAAQPPAKQEAAPSTTSGAAAYTPPEIAPMAQKKRSKKYRLYIAAIGLVFFVLAVGLSSLFFMMGSNTISGENIAIDISGPFTVSGGEAVPIQVGVTNQNTVAIESATLIVRYPPGTQSADEEGKGLFIERLPLETIDSGETLNIPLRAVVFGEENEEKVIEAEIEYRIVGSNSTFAKEAEPYRFKIGSSPVVISVDSLHRVSSGQEEDITLTISSNSPNPLRDLIVRAEYPNGFDYSSSDPQPVSGQNVWRIDELASEEETTITITGVVVGRESDEYTMHFSVGVPGDEDPLSLASVFSSASTDFTVEQPFVDVTLAVNNNETGTVAVESGERVGVTIEVTNSTSETIYDGRVELVLSGNALSDYNVETTEGFYDSRNNTVSWDASSMDALREIPPGEEVRLSVGLTPDPDIEITPQLAFDVSVRARRVSEGNATEELVGTAAAVAKVSSVTSVLTEAARDTSIWDDRGPLPPVAEEETTYTITMFTQNGTNDIGDTEVTANLPSYVEWLDNTTGAGTITFNETTRTVTWNVGSVEANQSKLASFQVALLPSISQVGTTPTLLGDQHLRATDRFTGAVVRARNNAVTTRLSSEAGYDHSIGEVLAEPEDE